VRRLKVGIAIRTDLFLVDVRQKAIEVALSLVSGAYQTSLLSYFTHRDLFPSLMKVRTKPSRDLFTDETSSFKILIPRHELLSLLSFSVFWQIITNLNSKTHTDYGWTTSLMRVRYRI
jgi:hypothetical protein